MAIEVTENQKMMNMIARMSVMPFLVIMVFSSCNNKLLEKDYEVIVENKYEFPIDFYILTEKPFSNQNEYDTSKILMYKSKASINFGNYVQNAQFYIGEVGTNGLLSTAGFANAHRVKITFEIGRRGNDFELRCYSWHKDGRKTELINNYLDTLKILHPSAERRKTSK